MKIRDNQALAIVSMALIGASYLHYILWGLHLVPYGGWSPFLVLIWMALYALSSPRALRLPGAVVFIGLFVVWAVALSVGMYDNSRDNVPDEFEQGGGAMGPMVVASPLVVLYWAVLERREHGLMWPLGLALGIYLTCFVFLVGGFLEIAG